MTETTPLPLDEAAKALGLSRRTVQRRLAAGTLTGRKQGTIWLVDVPTTTPAAMTDALRVRLADTVRHLADVTRERDSLAGSVPALARQLADSERELSHAQERLTATEGERDYLRQLAAALTSRVPQLPERAEPPKARWQFWRR